MTPPALLAYRQPHKVAPVRDWDDSFRYHVTVCERDGIRVHARSDGTYRHDSVEIAELAARERGESIDWSRR